MAIDFKKFQEQFPAAEMTKAVDNIVRAFWELDIPFECSGEIAAAHDKALDENGGSIPIETPAAPTGRRGRKVETADATPAAGRRSRRTETPAETADDTPVETDTAAEETPRRGRRRREADAPAETPADDSGTPKTYTRRKRG